MRKAGTSNESMASVSGLRRKSSTRSILSTKSTTIRSSFAPSAGAVDAFARPSLTSGTTESANTATSSRPGTRLNRKSKATPRTSKNKLSADKIAEKATTGKDVSAHFTNKFTVVRPLHRVNVDLTQGLLRQLDERAARLNISRQAVIKTLLSKALEDSPRR